MFNFRRSRVKRCLLLGSKILINWLLLTSNIIPCGSNTTDFSPQTFSYDVSSNTPTHQHTTESYDLNSIETQIKQFLNVHPANKSMDLLIRDVFNIDNPNPMYIFVLPGEKNRTLVLTRNSFDQAVYPNISTGQRFIKDDHNAKKLLQLLDNGAIKDKSKDADVDNLIFDLKDLDEAESMRIVAENVRTERNFIEFMERLNKDAHIGSNIVQENAPPMSSVDVSKSVNKEYEDLVSPKLKYKFEIDYSGDSLRHTTQGTVKTTELDWKDLGLDGWIGGLREPGKDFDTIVTESKTTENTNIISSTYIYYSKPKFPTAYNTLYRQTKPIEGSTYPTVFTKGPQQKKKHSTRHRRPKSKNNSVQDTYFEHTIKHPADQHNSVTGSNHLETATPPPTPPANINSWEIDMQIPSVLTDLLKKENPRLAEITETLSTIKPKWPITSSRAEHKDDDVYIARANNPFGHSTKWLWRNTSSADGTDNENRSKRGALELYSMVKCATGCDPLIFKGYGCYCGFLGSGRTLDAIDQGEWGGPGSCASRLCECDQTLSKCLRRFYCPRKRAVCTSSPWRLLQNVIMEI
ncbi:hypothetical protein HA402_003366 [Bradysia odoriphaga]|nr:hypothetical protein HA402_003366 [Bradysia odoriphaga]